MLAPTKTPVWALVESQHGVVSRAQLRELGFSSNAVDRRIASGRLHAVWPGVYAVGRPRLNAHGRWLAAVLACGREAALSHFAAAAILEIRRQKNLPIEVSVPSSNRRRPRGITVHRRTNIAAADLIRRHGVPVTNPVCTLVDIAPRLTTNALEAAVSEADKLGLVDPDRLRNALDHMPRRPGIGRLRELLDRGTFRVTASELERRFLPLARRAGLPAPETGVYLNGFEVDFHWPALGLVVETDGLRYHRTPAQQARDRVRDQAHIAAGLTPLRFTHAQVRFEPATVQAILAAVARRLSTNA